MFLISATVLFLELALIRWSGAQVRAVAYFPNLILIGSFLGLGIGCLRGEGRSLASWWMPALLLLAVAYVGLSRVVFTQTSAVEEHLWLLYYDLPKDAPVVDSVAAPVIACFVLAVLAFIPPGQMIAQRLRAFQQFGHGLQGYCWDLGGSLLGIGVFALAAFSRAQPVHWFLLGAIGAAGVFRHSRARLAIHIACSILLLAVVYRSERAQIYSPYYALTHTRGDQAEHVLANGSLHQTAFSTAMGGYHATVAAGYHLPYTMSGHKPRRALVLGAGTGNDVATLLQEGAESVDAVEIDPEIIKLGRKIHPDRPYDSPRVRLISGDARAFLNETPNHYDTIVFGTLDSMTRLSALSNVRLDNFVYTTNCFQAARTRLTDDGALILYFMTGHEALGLRIGAMLTRAFGHAPVVHHGHHTLFNTIFMTGPAFAALNRDRADERLRFFSAYARVYSPPDDDWPFLYLSGRSLSTFYRVIIASISALAIAGVFFASRDFRLAAVRRGGVDGPMFLFGLGFLLLETRAVTAMNLVWGATWLTSAVVFGAILLTVLLGTIVFSRFPLSLRTSITGLSASLAGLYFLPGDWLLTMSLPLRILLSIGAVGAPVLFAATGFARVYESRANVGHAFGWNLLGAVAGGLCEFLSMIVGLRALLLLALAVYLAAYLLQRARAVRPTLQSVAV
ncbi:MAG: methyltransferase domain-containing protein [Opitutaceae bacterium]|nr:methyltransferase domain-containing protein [Opitutaceae bacterium]